MEDSTSLFPQSSTDEERLQVRIRRVPDLDNGNLFLTSFTCKKCRNLMRLRDIFQVIEQAKEDVERCLSLYEQSGKIPTTILEAR